MDREVAMPRPLRYTLPGVPQHVVQRGNDRKATFFHRDDYRFYLAALYEASRRWGVQIYAYALMTNHVHLLAVPDAPFAISRMLQSVGRRYVRYVNLNYQRSGTLWEGRHRASLVQAEAYLDACHAYIELNPVRAGLIADARQYPWSSCAHYAGEATDPLVTDSPLFLALGHDLATRRAAHWARLLCGLRPETLTAIRTATQQGAVIGRDGFRAEIERVLQRRLPGAPRGRPRKTAEAGTAPQRRPG
jgi:putative transposase